MVTRMRHEGIIAPVPRLSDRRDGRPVTPGTAVLSRCNLPKSAGRSEDRELVAINVVSTIVCDIPSEHVVGVALKREGPKDAMSVPRILIDERRATRHPGGTQGARRRTVIAEAAFGVLPGGSDCT